MAQPMFTIAIPVRNGADYLRDALDSALSQTYRDYEIVVSDNASQDTTPEILLDYKRRFSHIRIARSETMLSLSENWNRVYGLAIGEWVKILAHDDLLHPQCLARIAQALSEAPDTWLSRCGIVGTGEEWLFEGVLRSSIQCFATQRARLYQILHTGSCRRTTTRSYNSYAA